MESLKTRLALCALVLAMFTIHPIEGIHRPGDTPIAFGAATRTIRSNVLPACLRFSMPATFMPLIARAT